MSLCSLAPAAGDCMCTALAVDGLGWPAGTPASLQDAGGA